MADLITNARAIQNDTLNQLNTSNPTLLASLISAASQAIQRACHRDFVLTSYQEYYSGANYPYDALLLRQFPVTKIDRIATNPQQVLMISNNNSTTVSRATVATTTTGINLLSVTGGTPTTTTLLYATYPTVQLIANAINLVSGWTASVVGPYGIYASVDIKPIQGAVTALYGPASLAIYVEDRYSYVGGIAWGDSGVEGWELASTREEWRIDEETGTIYGRFPRGQWNMRVDYTAGFATILDDLQEATVQHVQDLYQAAQFNSNLSFASLGTSSYKTATTSSATMNTKVAGLIQRYIAPDRTMR